MTTEVIAVVLSWAIWLLWIGLVTYLIDQVGVMLGWWTNETFIGVPKGKR